MWAIEGDDELNRDGRHDQGRKTTVLTALEGAHFAASGRRFVPLAPTTRARDAMVESGFDGADTVQRFLVSGAMLAHAAAAPGRRVSAAVV